MVNTSAVVEAASKLLRELGVKEPSDIRVELIAQHFGATVTYSRLESSDGRLICIGNKAIIGISTFISNEGRRRFSIGHELGHFMMHKKFVDLFVCSSGDMSQWVGSNEREIEANYFSSEILMPSELFRPLCVRQPPNMALIKKLSGVFRSSLTATAVRYLHLTREPCALVYCTNGKIKWFIKNSNDFKYIMKGRDEDVDPESYAYDAFRGEGGNDKGDMVPGTAWLIDNYPSVSRLELMESTCPLPSLNSTITLLWEP